MRILSCFVDESGDFGEFSKHSPYYIITISYNIFNLGKQLKTMGLLVITDVMINRVMAMWKGGFFTKIFDIAVTQSQCECATRQCEKEIER